MKQPLIFCLIITFHIVFIPVCFASSDHFCELIDIYKKRNKLTSELWQLGHKGISLDEKRQIGTEDHVQDESLDKELKDTVNDFNSKLLIIEKLLLEETNKLNSMTIKIVEMQKLYNESDDNKQKSVLKQKIDAIYKCINSYECELKTNRANSNASLE